jgi:hypothetical protein
MSDQKKTYEQLNEEARHQLTDLACRMQALLHPADVAQNFLGPVSACCSAWARMSHANGCKRRMKVAAPIASDTAKQEGNNSDTAHSIKAAK